MAIGVAACGGDGGDAAGTTAVPSIESDPTKDSGAGGEPILIKTRVTIQIPYHPREFTGDVLRGSFIGDSPFCPDGRFRDQHGNDAIGLVDRTFVCPDGSLRIGFTPGFPQGRTQSGPWKVLSGTGAFEALQGNSEMEVKYERGSHTKGREAFTGTVAH